MDQETRSITLWKERIAGMSRHKEAMKARSTVGRIFPNSVTWARIRRLFSRRNPQCSVVRSELCDDAGFRLNPGRRYHHRCVDNRGKYGSLGLVSGLNNISTSSVNALPANLTCRKWLVTVTSTCGMRRPCSARLPDQLNQNAGPPSEEGYTPMKNFMALVSALVAVPAVFVNAAAAQTTHTVQLISVDFVQQDITIQVGDTVHWEWVSGGFHNVESGTIVNGAGVPDDNFISGDPTNVVGTTYDLVFDQAFLDAKPMPGNVYPYYCVIHTSVDMAGTVTVTAGDCVSDSDCSSGNVCVANKCEPLPAPDGCTLDADCDDQDPCTDDTCVSGSCQNLSMAGCCATDSDCEDNNICTDDSCSGGTCLNAANTALCDDNDACTTEVCDKGACVATAIENCCEADVDCDDGDDCTDDACTDGLCENVAIAGCDSTDSSESGSTSSPCGSMGMIVGAFLFLGLGVFKQSRRRVRALP